MEMKKIIMTHGNVSEADSWINVILCNKKMKENMIVSINKDSKNLTCDQDPYKTANFILSGKKLDTVF